MPGPTFELIQRYEHDPEKLRAAIQADQAVRQEAEAELTACMLIDQQRCVVTNEYADILREALA